MRIVVNITRRTALAAVLYALDNSSSIKNIKEFKLELGLYIENYGEVMQDNHISEYHHLHADATIILNKYFK